MASYYSTYIELSQEEICKPSSLNNNYRFYLCRLEKRGIVVQEIKALKTLSHPNIVTYFDHWEETPPLDWQDDNDLWSKNTSR